MHTLTRRNFNHLFFTGICANTFIANTALCAAPASTVKLTRKIALNTGTIRGYKLPLAEQIKQVAQAGYTGIEPWCSDLAAAEKTDTALREHAKQIADSGLTVVSAIGFAKWAVNEETMRKEGLEEMKRDMERIAQLGGHHIAASPAGVNAPGYLLENRAAAERYETILELGKSFGITPILEFWGPSSNLSTLDQCLDIVTATNHPEACVLADIYHLYKGGSTLEKLRLLSQQKIPVLHINDYPCRPPREIIRDADRIWPGDGIAPFQQILSALRTTGAQPWFSLELFNATYWKHPISEMLRTGYGKVQHILNLYA